MQWLLIVLLVVSAVFFVWQLSLFIRDLIKHLKNKKAKKQEKNASGDDDSSGRKDDVQ